MPPAPVSETKGRVLVTGSDGFTGRYLVPELRRRGYTVIGHVQAMCDLRDRDAVGSLIAAAHPDAVIHLAGISFVAHGSPSEIYDVNTVGTTNLLDALASPALNLRKVVLASSSQVYGPSSADYLDEEHECRPNSHYACSKLAMERMAANYRENFPIVITRPFNYTGVGQPPHFLIPKIVDHFLRGETSIKLGNLDAIRDISDVTTVCDVYCRLLEAPVENQTLNVCSGVGRSVRSIIDEVSQVAGRTMRVVVRPEFVRASDISRLVGRNFRLVTAIGPLLANDFQATVRSMVEAPRPAH